MIDKSEILFLYDSTYSIPNGDPFTGEQRYDDETKKILVSDVRIKRFIRDYFTEQGQEIYILNSTEEDAEKKTSAVRMKELKEKYKDDPKVKDDKGKKIIGRKLLCQKCIDVRLFGGISTEKGDAFNLTGPVQFALLNPSLNSVDLRIHQNTSVFSSDTEKKQGAIGTTSLVPYSLNQIHGWINPFTAKHTQLDASDIDKMFRALWHSINNSNTRSKSNQNSILLLQFVYSRPVDKVYNVDRLLKLQIKENKRSEQLRSSEDYEFDFSSLEKLAQTEFIKQIRYFCAFDELEKKLQKVPNISKKLQKIDVMTE